MSKESETFNDPMFNMSEFDEEPVVQLQVPQKEEKPKEEDVKTVSREFTIGGEKVTFEGKDYDEIISKYTEANNKWVEERLLSKQREDEISPEAFHEPQKREYSKDELAAAMLNFQQDPIGGSAKFIEEALGFPIEMIQQAIVGGTEYQKAKYGQMVADQFLDKYCQFDENGNIIGGKYNPTKSNAKKMIQYMKVHGLPPTLQSYEEAFRELDSINALKPLPKKEDKSAGNASADSNSATALSDSDSIISPDLGGASASELYRKYDQMSADELLAEIRKTQRR